MTKFFKSKFLPAILFFVSASAARADVWTTTRSWTDAEDKGFSDFIRTVPLDVFTRQDSPWRGIATDCSKAVYVLRTIYAYQRGLPIQFSNRSRVNLSNTSKEFDAIPEGPKRLSKFINLLRQHVNTETLVDDTYPVAVNRQTVKAGSIYLHPQQPKDVPLTYRSGHVYYIQDVLANGMIRYISSTVPMMVRDLQPRLDIVFAPFNVDGGFRAWKRPDSNLKPGESSMQFQLAGWTPNRYRDTKFWKAWQKEVRTRLQTREATLEEEFKAAVFNVEGYIKERIHLVNRGWNLYQSKYKSAACMNEQDYDDYSTPTRDVKIQSELSYLRRAAVKYLESQGESSPYQAIPYLFEKYSYEVLPGQKLDMNDLWKTFQSAKVLAISEPEHSPKVRWGIEPQTHWPCPDRAKQYVGGENVGR